MLLKKPEMLYLRKIRNLFIKISQRCCIREFVHSVISQKCCTRNWFKPELLYLRKLFWKLSQMCCTKKIVRLSQRCCIWKKARYQVETRGNWILLRNYYEQTEKNGDWSSTTENWILQITELTEKYRRSRTIKPRKCRTCRQMYQEFF